MITAQGIDCVVTLEDGALTIIRFPGASVRGGRMSTYSMRVLPASAVVRADVRAPVRWRHGALLLTIDADVPGRGAEVISFAKPQLAAVLDLVRALHLTARN